MGMNQQLGETEKTPNYSKSNDIGKIGNSLKQQDAFAYLRVAMGTLLELWKKKGHIISNFSNIPLLSLLNEIMSAAKFLAVRSPVFIFEWRN